MPSIDWMESRRVESKEASDWMLNIQCPGSAQPNNVNQGQLGEKCAQTKEKKQPSVQTIEKQRPAKHAMRHLYRFHSDMLANEIVGSPGNFRIFSFSTA